MNGFARVGAVIAVVAIEKKKQLINRINAKVYRPTHNTSIDAPK
jgi:hypothetical protein